MTLQEFYNKYNGKTRVGNTDANKGECVGLSSLWMDNFNIPHVYGHAKDLYANAPDEYFAKIPNTPAAIVQEGDIVVWTASYNGTFGHTGIAKGKASVVHFDCFEQNDPLGSTPHVKNYNYAYVLGWLRPKGAVIAQPIPQPPAMNDQTVIDLGQYGMLEIQAIRGKLGDLEKAKKQNDDLRNSLTLIQVQVQELKNQLADALHNPPTPLSSLSNSQLISELLRRLSGR